jgi:Ni/Fe-hydrogenase subunit HybB-like protein
MTPPKGTLDYGVDEKRVDKLVSVARSPVIEPGHSFGSVTDKITSIVLRRGTPLWWLGGIAITFGMLQLLLLACTLLFAKGVGVWGINIPVGWGFAIINFVWWIGIGHAGTLISAILALLKQSWRNSINRFAEAMTLFAVMCAGLFPVLHTGRPWLAYWLFPYPNSMGIWPQFRSPLIWDVFAVSTYATVSALFWYVGLVPDLATMRDTSRHPVPRFIYGMLAMGWRGSARHWKRYETAYILLAGLSTPLVLSVHTVVSFDFAISILPGWHTTIFPPYFVAGAIYCGFAMVLFLAIPIRALYGLEDLITMRHLVNSAKVMLATGLIVAYGYGMEAFAAFYSGNKYESFMWLNRAWLGPYWWSYWALLATNIFTPQILWFRRVRQSPFMLFVISTVILVGMWLERFVIVVTSLHRDFLSSSWGFYKPTSIDWATFVGTLGLFFTLMFLFLRLVPAISMFEVRTLLPEAKVSKGGDAHLMSSADL